MIVSFDMNLVFDANNVCLKSLSKLS